MSTQQAAIKGAEAAQQAARDWQAVRGDGAIQFTPLPDPVVPKQAPPPEWLKSLGEFLHDLFEPIGRALGMDWGMAKWVMLGIGALAALFLLWRLAEPLILRWRMRQPDEDAEAPHWAPDRAAALALLEDADRLAAAGRFDAATHLLLQRSVHQIAEARPDWVHPASTAREIAAIAALPAPARSAFGLIATRVERSLFGLTALDAADWHAARAAYAEFALQRLPGREAGA
ncbi:hypothetical protein [Novosphingobium sp.]|uniref:hypothetical protein n=1 Tax=Novosphingobium sp. TaxID=1874826 RepID=UPI0035AE2CA2